MPIDEKLLQTFVLQTRLMFLESLVLKLHIVVTKLAKPDLSIDASLQLTREVLEAAATDIENLYLRDKAFARLAPEERTLLADESREILETMKEHASLIVTRMREK